MSLYATLPSYVLGTACIGRGIMAILSPRNEYGHIGLPLEAQAPSYAVVTSDPHYQDDKSRFGVASPLMYFKGIREVSYGLTMVVLQWQGNEAALTTFAAILSLVRLGDGMVVWLHGGKEMKSMAWGHWLTGIGFLGWVASGWVF